MPSGGPPVGRPIDRTTGWGTVWRVAILAGLAAVAVGLAAVAVGAIQRPGGPLDHSVALPGSRLVIDPPSSWDHGDAGQTFDAAWAARQKQLHPADGAFIDSLVENVQSAGGTAWYARLDTDANGGADAWVLTNTSTDGLWAPTLHEEAERSVDLQLTTVRPGTTATDVTLATGPAVRLDWSFELGSADGTTNVGFVRSYWIQDGLTVVVIQLTWYGAQADAVASFEAGIRTLRWSDARG